MERLPMLQRLAQVSARLGWRILLFAIAVGLVAGIIGAIAWEAKPAEAPFQGNEGDCKGGGQPPCFDGLPDLSSMPLALVPEAIYLLALFVLLLLSLPSLLAGAWNGVNGRWRSALRALLTFAGPMLVFIGTETIPHAVIALPCNTLEADVCSRFHGLEHVIFGLVPMTLLYRSALLRWSPGVVR